MRYLYNLHIINSYISHYTHTTETYQSFQPSQHTRTPSCWQYNMSKTNTYVCTLTEWTMQKYLNIKKLRDGTVFGSCITKSQPNKYEHMHMSTCIYHITYNMTSILNPSILLVIAGGETRLPYLTKVKSITKQNISL